MLSRIVKAFFGWVVGRIARSAEKGVPWTSRAFAEGEQSEPWYVDFLARPLLPWLFCCAEASASAQR